MDDELGHGHSVAAWTGVVLLIVASALLSVGIYFGLTWATWAGIAVAVLGIGAWVGLQTAGDGQSAGSHKH